MVIKTTNVSHLTHAVDNQVWSARVNKCKLKTQI